jgi:hypothetical protein
MKFSVIAVLASMLVLGCGRKVCEPLSTQGCECAEALQGAQVCSPEGTGWWGCVCTPGEGVLSGDVLKERTTCRRLEVIESATETFMQSHEACPGMEDLDLAPGDAWGESIVVVCSLENDATVTSSGMDRRFGSQDDLTADTCEKIEKFGSIAKWEAAMREQEEQDLVARGQEAEEEDDGPELDIEYLKSLLSDASTEGATGSGRPKKPPKKPPREGETQTTSSSGYFDPIAGIDDTPKKKKKHK